MKRIVKWLAAGAGIALASYGSYAAVTWLRYGHPRRARGDAHDALLDELMRDHDVCERHEVAVAAPPAVTLAAAKEMKLDDSRIIRAIFRARELILRGASATGTSRGFVEDMQAIGWGVLAEVPGRELVMGGVTRPWEANPVFRALPPEQFTAFAEPDHVKIAFTLRVDPTPDGGSIFRTETRAMATDAGARKKFRLYWSLLSPGILLIRRAMLPPLAAAAERAWRVEGDDLLAGDAGATLTHAITIDAPPKVVWPWLVQMGGQRAGWYSWDLLDNGGRRSADRIIPGLQHLELGDVLPARPTGKEGFKVLRIIPERALVLESLTPSWKGTWAFVLEPMGPDQTRLVTRYRAAYPPSARMALLVPVLTTVHAFMEKKQLRTIKHHAEHRHVN